MNNNVNEFKVGFTPEEQAKVTLVLLSRIYNQQHALSRTLAFVGSEGSDEKFSEIIDYFNEAYAQSNDELMTLLKSLSSDPK
jgi:hypothetical protein